MNSQAIDLNNLLVLETDIEDLIESYLTWGDIAKLAIISRSQFYEMTKSNTIPLWVRLSKIYQKNNYSDKFIITQLGFSHVQKLVIVWYNHFKTSITTKQFGFLGDFMITTIIVIPIAKTTLTYQRRFRLQVVSIGTDKIF